MKKTGGRIYKGLCTILTITIAAVLFLSGTVYADTLEEGDNAQNAEWWRYTNSETNNAITDRPTPVAGTEAWEKWSFGLGGGFTNSPTPPILIGDYVYTVCGTRLYELEKETGKVHRISDPMPAATNYSLNAPLYADGKIFVAINGGIICAFNLSDLSLAWKTSGTGIVTGQMISPLSYKKINGTGYLYAGTRKNKEGAALNGGELLCVTTDDNDVTGKTKSLKWHFHPKSIDAANLESENCEAEGYYHTGAYVSEKFLAVGSDNGTLDQYTDAKTAFYTLDPVTGNIISRNYSIEGAVRSSIVYESGYLYFVSTKAILYKIAVDEEGHLGELSSIDLEDYGAVSSSVTPLVYGGRIYIGFCGPGKKYSADGGHGIFVIQNDSSLREDSYLYKISTPGYPQGGLLLSTALEDNDFDQDGNPDGRVYIYCTLNTPPGGIYYTYDAPGQTSPAPLTVEESKLFIPSKTEHCISPIAVDAEGTMYYKNDSGYLFAVESSQAALMDLKVLNSNGEELKLNQKFQPKLSEYYATAATAAEEVVLQMTPAEGVNVTVNGTAYISGSSMSVALSENEETDILVETSKNGQKRTYKIHVNKASANANLSALASTKSVTNEAPNASNMRNLVPEFDSSVLEYSIDWIKSTSGTNNRMNLFLGTENKKAEVKVFAGKNVDSSSGRVKSDGTIPEFSVASTVYPKRFPVYAEDPAKDSTVTIRVTAEDGITVKEYLITFNRRIFVEEVVLSQTMLELDEGDEKQLSASVSPGTATDPTITWVSTDEKVVTIDQNGKVFAKGPGTAEIKATSSDGPEDVCSVTVFANHKIVKKEPSPATLDKEGIARECWGCEICGRFFEDEEGQTEIPKEEVVIPKLINIGKASVFVPTQTYTGKTLTPAPTVMIGNKKLTQNVDYTVACNNKNAGTASLTLTGIGKYVGSKTVPFKISKAVKKTMTAKVKKKLFKVSAKKKTVLKSSKVFAIKNKVGTVVYKQLTKNSKISVAKNGKITIKKGLKRGKSYSIKVQITDGSANYIGATRKVTVKIKAK